MRSKNFRDYLFPPEGSFLYLRHRPSGLNVSYYTAAHSSILTQELGGCREKQSSCCLKVFTPAPSRQPSTDGLAENLWVLPRMMAKHDFRQTTLFVVYFVNVVFQIVKCLIIFPLQFQERMTCVGVSLVRQ